MFRRTRTLTLLLLTLVAGAAAAQTLELGAGAPPAGGWARLSGVRAGGATVTFEVRLPAPEVGVGLSANQAFGPLGNVVFEAWGAFSAPASGAVAEGRLGARGVLGPVALRVTLLGFGADPGAFRPRDLASAERPRFATPAAGAQLGVTWRLERSSILEAAPELYLTPAGVALRLDGQLRLLRALGDDELRLLLHAYATPGFEAGAGALGAAVLFPRGRAPDVTVGVTLGLAPTGVLPGASVALGQQLGPVRLDLDAAFEPYRLDVAALRLSAAARLPLAEPLPRGSELALEGALESGLGTGWGAVPGSRWWLGTALRLPVQLP